MGFFRNFRIFSVTLSLSDSFKKLCGRFVAPDDVHGLYQIVEAFYSEHGLLDSPMSEGFRIMQDFTRVYYEAQIQTPNILFLRVLSHVIQKALQHKLRYSLTLDEWLYMNETICNEFQDYPHVDFSLLPMLQEKT